LPVIVVQILVFASIILIFGALTSVRNARKEAIKKMFGLSEDKQNPAAKTNNRVHFLDNIISLAHKAGFRNNKHEIILICLAVATASYITGYVLFGHPIIAALTTPAGFFIVYNILKSRVKKRGEEMSDEMEDWLLVLASYLESGVSLAQAIRLSVDRLDGVLLTEVEDIVKAIDFGNTAKDALEMFEHRIPAVEYKMVTVAVKVNSVLGGNLAQALKNIANTVAERRRIRSEAKSLSSQGKLASNAIAIIIIGLIATLRLMNPEYLDPFFKTPLGMIIFTAAIGWAVLGWWLVRKVSMPKI